MKSVSFMIASISMALCTIFLGILAFKAVYSLLYSSQQGQSPNIDYTNVVVILLTTVTVVFSVFAIVLGILGAVGFKNLKNDAGKFAAKEATRQINDAFAHGGAALTHIDAEFVREGGHLRSWMTSRIQQEVILLLPLVAERLRGNDSTAMAPGEPTDEGETD